ncbi:MAG: hypothetical protein EXR73_08765 [Myxococcales bacterium]|nr:hypothetical protein [Myxococcales bacterium]
MAAPILTVTLTCASWDQLTHVYDKDLVRGVLFLRSQRPPAEGTMMTVALTLPSGEVMLLPGQVARHVAPGSRGPGVELSFGAEGVAGVAKIAQVIAKTARAKQAPDAAAPPPPPVPAAASTPALPFLENLAPPREADTFEDTFDPARVLTMRRPTTAAVPAVGLPSETGRHRAAQAASGRSPRVSGSLAAVFLFGDMPDLSTHEGTVAAPPPAPTIATEESAADHADQLLEAGKHVEALAAYEACLRADAGHQAAQLGRELANGFMKLAAADRTTAARHFAAALQIDPHHARATRELAALQRAGREPEKTPSLFGKLFGRKP